MYLSFIQIGCGLQSLSHFSHSFKYFRSNALGSDDTISHSYQLGISIFVLFGCARVCAVGSPVSTVYSSILYCVALLAVSSLEITSTE